MKAQQTSSTDQTAISAEKAAYGKKDSTRKEYGGVGYRRKDGSLGFTDPKHIPVPGSKDSDATAINLNDRPKGTTVVFLYHSHGDATPRSNEFSSDDLVNAWSYSQTEGRSIPSYIGDANGGVYRYTPTLGGSSPSSDDEGRALGQVTTIVPPQ